MKIPLAMAGSKRRVIGKLWTNIPRPESGRFVVPFFGTGADSYFFFKHGFDVVAGDAQRILVDLHNELEDARERALEYGPTDRESYLRIREEFNRTKDPALFLILIRRCWNKVVRFNRKGEFNVGPGELGSELPSLELASSWADFIEAIDGVSSWGFERTMELARPEDVVYLDPPYWGTFDNFTGQLFDHDRLFDLIHWLPCPWALSNSAKRDWTEVFPDAEIFEVTRSGAINSNTNDRGSVREILIVGRPT